MQTINTFLPEFISFNILSQQFSIQLLIILTLWRVNESNSFESKDMKLEISNSLEKRFFKKDGSVADMIKISTPNLLFKILRDSNNKQVTLASYA